jgi:hypothetical protein
MNTQLDDTIRTVLGAQAKAVDVDIERPELTPEIEENAKVIPFKRATVLLTVLTAAALIVGVIVVRGNTPAKHGVIVSGTGMKVVLAGVPLTDYDFAHAPNGFHASSATPPGPRVDAVCYKWSVDKNSIVCSSVTGGFNHVYTDQTPTSASVDRYTITVSHSSDRSDLSQFEKGEQVQVQGHPGWFEPNTFPDPSGVNLPSTSEAIRWIDDQGTLIDISFGGLPSHLPTRAQMLDLANHVRQTTPNATIGLQIAAATLNGTAFVSIAVAGTDEAPCIGAVLDSCVPLATSSGREIAFAHDFSFQGRNVIVGMVDPRVAAVRLTGSGSELATATVALPGYHQRFFVIHIPTERPTTYTLLDSSDRTLQQGALDPALLPSKSVPSEPIILPHAVRGLEFRVVQRSVPCENAPKGTYVLHKTLCYVLGPSLIENPTIAGATPIQGSAAEGGRWTVSVKLGPDVVAQVVAPYDKPVAQEIGIVYNGVFEGTQPVGEQFATDIMVVGFDLTKAEAQALAKSLNG